MYLRPCARCDLRGQCELRQEWRDKLRGQGIASVSFRCTKKWDRFKPGRRVSAHLLNAGEIEYPFGQVGGDWEGTIVATNKRGRQKVSVVLDDPSGLKAAERHGQVSVWPDNCTLLDGHDEMCECGWPMRSHVEEFYCWHEEQKGARDA